MKTIMALILFLSPLVSCPLLATDITLELGQTHELPLTASRIWVEKKAVIKAEVRNRKILLTGKQNGDSQIRVGNRHFTIQVVDTETSKLFAHLKQEVKKIPGLSVQLAQGKVELTGYLHTWEIWKQLLKGHSYNTPFLLKARISKSLRQVVQKNIDQDLASQGLLSMNLNLEPYYHVRLHPQQPGLDLYQKYFQQLGISVVLLKESLTMEPSVRVQITVAEISKKYSRSFGMEWMDSNGQARFDILPTGLVNADNLQATLTALETEGHAKLLASPNLICRSGKEAEFLAGGEFPIKILNYKIQDIIWKKYGVLLKIKPFADSSGKMSLSLETEVSSLGPLVEGIPSIESNKVSSHFDISHSQVIALSGLLRDQTSEGHKGLPWLSQLPVLGPLFSSQSFLNQKTELVIFVRPQLMNQESLTLKDEKPSHLGGEPLPKN